MALKGFEQVIRNLNREIAKIKSGSVRGLGLAGEFIRRRSQEICPVDTGNLRSSAYVAQVGSPEKPKVQIGYTASYAPFVHEMVSASFRRPGASAKFLQRPLQENVPQIINIIKNEAKLE